MNLLDWFIHLDTHLNELAASLGPWLYVILFAIIFCETGLVVAPFLPGDSLLFAVGTLAATPGSVVRIEWLIPLLIVAAVAGDAVNYAAGRFIGPRVFRWEGSWFFNPRHLDRAQAFYEKYGGKAIVLARFVPIVRTFAPFVAGIGKMKYPRFWMYNVTGAIIWIVLFIVLGFWFGNLPIVQKNYEIVILAIIVISVIPMVFEWWKSRQTSSTEPTAK